VGAGAGGLYAVHRFSQQGLKVLGIEGGGGVGGVWYHNRYPGARVDVDSVDSSYHFSDELMEKWNWSERYAAQPELLAYFDYVADTFGLRDKFAFNTRVIEARWDSHESVYHIRTSSGGSLRTRYLVMATGNLTVGKKPQVAGLDRFKGQWVNAPTGPGSPSVIANLIVQNEFALDWIADLIAFADEHGYRSVEPTEEAVDKWVAEGIEVSKNSIRRRYDNYMVKVNDDGSRVFIPYAGGFFRYVAECQRIPREGYKEFAFR
jgi:hypothetical protein